MAEEIQENGQKDEQKEFLVSKIDELIEGIGSGYSQAFLEELINRLEKTVEHFHEEVSELINSLKAQHSDREAKLEQLLKGDGETTSVETEPGESPEQPTAAEREMSDWEKRLEEKVTATGESPSKPAEEKPKEKKEKKGFFRRKKK
tara:strand:+ start:2222 stop:2662 length:441 start_codon:yes stop_codon:yes gene_type:complete